MTSFFLYTDENDGNLHNEIDIEFLGKDCTTMQANYYTNDWVGHEVPVVLGFNACSAIHKYAIDYRVGAIEWYVDGVSRLRVTGAGLPTVPLRIMANLWPGVGVDGWLNPFSYSGPLTAKYYDIRWTP